MRDKIFYTTCFGFAFGIFLRSFIFINMYTVLWIGILAVFLLLLHSLILKNTLGILISVLVFTFSLGVLRFHIADEPAPAIFESQLGQTMTFSGKVIDEPGVTDDVSRFTFETAEQGSTTDIIVSAQSADPIAYGDTLTVMGKLEVPKNFLTNTGKTFDYVDYLRKDGVFFLMSNAEAQVTATGGGNFIKRILFKAEEKFLDKVNYVIPSPESTFMGGLILGERQGFSQDLRNEFVTTGTIHMVALSGYNVTIVAEWIMKFFGAITFLPKNFGLGAGILSIILFVIMTGGSSTAIRAGIMATLALTAKIMGRNYDVGRALIFAGIVMLLINPFILVFDVSFQLSFLATIAVIYLSPKMEKYFMWMKSPWLADIAAVTFSAYIFVAPFILYEMGNFSLVALPANIAILPFIPLTMILGFITGFLGLIFFPLAIPFGFLSYFFLHYELAVISFFAHLPFASFSIPDFPLLIVILIYMFFFYKLFWKSLKKLAVDNSLAFIGGLDILNSDK